MRKGDRAGVGISLFLLLAGSFFVWMKLAGVDGEQESVQSISPADEEVVFRKESDASLGLVKVQIVRCKRCGQTISYVKFDGVGRPVGGYMRPIHICGRKWGQNDPRYQGAGTGPMKFDLHSWLAQWQKKLSRWHP